MTQSSNSFIDTLKSHLVFRVASVYAIAGWLIIQFADISLEAFDANAWMQPLLILVLAGFPVAVTITWFLSHASQQGTVNKAIAITSIVTAVVLSTGLYTSYRSNGSSAENTAVAAARSANPILAVLPFTNFSSDPENEFLADGMTEDIITLLAQSPGMEVIARNSTFKYKNTSPDVRDVGRDLQADYVVEGSVRPMAGTIRVTVQVIESSTGAHVWAEQFDRPLTDFFAIQDDVSLGIAAAVGDIVFREEYNRVAQSRSDDLTAWVLTSKADMGFSLASTTEGDFMPLLANAREAVELDPDYALAHAVLARTLAINTLFVVGSIDSRESAEAKRHAQTATRLAPDDPRVLAYSAIALLWTGHPVEALAVARKVINISPSYAEGLAYYGDILIHNGLSQEAVPYLQKAIRLTPNAPQLGFYQGCLGEAFMHHGDFEAALGPLLESDRISYRQNQVWVRYLAGTRLRLGDARTAKNLLQSAHALQPDRPISADAEVMAFYSTDSGGEHFLALWQDLQSLTASD